MRTKAMGPQYYGRSKADTKGISLQLDKTFKKGLKVGKKDYLKDWNIGGDLFMGETTGIR